jgi:hypothetical protein
MPPNPALTNELRLRHERTRESVRHWCARAVTGPSVIRVFEKGTTNDLLPVLLGLPIDAMTQMDNRTEFEAWFETQLQHVAKAISKRNATNKRVQPGLKWGHAAKVLSLYLRDVVLHSRFFLDKDADRIATWLFVPVDSRVMERLTQLGVRLPFAKIKDIATRNDFYFIQDILAESCEAGTARVIFDDVWADREPLVEPKESGSKRLTSSQ